MKIVKIKLDKTIIMYYINKVIVNNQEYNLGMPAKLNTEEFIKKAKEVHGDKYDYSLVEYIGSNEKVKIICPIHGFFEQIAFSHLSNHGCPTCGLQRSHLSSSDEEFIKKAKEIHGDKYDYSLVDYKKNKEKVKIICPIHGVFEQRPGSHLNGVGCRTCQYIKQSIKQTLSSEEFIKKAKEIHGDKYDYSLVDYKKNKEKVKIICPMHGIFEQIAGCHLNSKGCPKCKSSKGEILISNFLQAKKVIFEEQKRFPDCKYKLPLPFDFYLPDYNISIEFDGIQHFKPTSFSSDKSSETKNKNLEIVKFRDSIKNNYCKTNNIKLIRISYLEKNDIYNILSRSIFNNYDYSFSDCF